MHQAMRRFFVMTIGKTMNSDKTFLDKLTISTNLCEVGSVNDSDVIIAFVSIASRAGTDIKAAMQKIPECKPVILVVLHHTFDPYDVVPDSRRSVNRTDVFAVDCLYYEDQGLLNCLRNDEAIRAVKNHLRCEDLIREDPPHQVDRRWIAGCLVIICVVLCIVLSVVVNIGVGFGVSIGLGIAGVVVYLVSVNMCRNHRFSHTVYKV